MNERIRECWLKAAREDAGETWDTQVQFIERFAELIVRECAEIAKSTDPSDGDDYRSGRYWAGLDIKKHFGVEDTKREQFDRAIKSAFEYGADLSGKETP